MSIALKTDALKEALKTYTNPVAVSLDGKKTTISFTPDNKDLLEFLQENLPLTDVQKAKISSWLYASEAVDGLGDVEVSSPTELYKKLAYIGHSTEPTLELKLGEKWYPVLGTIEKFKSMMGGIIVYVTAYADIAGLQYRSEVMVGSWSFENEDDEETANPRTINELLGVKGIRIATKENIEAAKKRNGRLAEFQALTNKLLDGWGEGLVFHNFWGWQSMNVGWKESPSKLVVEPTLENRYARHERMGMQDQTWKLPFVRCFSFQHKDYVYVDIENLKIHEFHRDGINKIVLPNKMLKALGSIFHTSQKNIFGDLFHGRHGGIVVLANGPSGVGKTLTAEVFAEFQERPLYTMEMAEIGTNVQTVEANLQKIFARAKKWNAVLLFDEADIFLSEREASDLERSAIVGIFLRLLDYYEGTFFLTTNRGEGIDKAFKSRVTLYLDYPQLNNGTRGKIWTSMLAAAGITAEEAGNVTWNEVYDEPLNGRQIRNQVRLLKMMYPEGRITTADIKESMEFTTR